MIGSGNHFDMALYIDNIDYMCIYIYDHFPKIVDRSFVRVVENNCGPSGLFFVMRRHATKFTNYIYIYIYIYM